MNPYKATESSYQLNPNENRSWVKTIAVTLVAFPVLLFLLFDVANVITYLFIDAFEISLKPGEYLTDAIVSFAILVAFYFLIYVFKSVHANIIVVSLVIMMAVHWGIASGFIYTGFHSSTSIWYQVNVALNDLLAAVLVIFIKNRKSKA